MSDIKKITDDHWNKNAFNTSEGVSVISEDDYDRLVDKLVDNTKWIDVKDRVPEKSFEFTALSKAVLTIDTNHSIEIRYFDTKRNKWVYTEPNRFVTHWMPLPNPPE